MSAPLAIEIKILPHGADLPPPAYESAGAAGLDLLAAIEPGVKIILNPGARRLIPTGIALAIPPNYEAQIRPRSGLALKAGVTVLNAPGTIDSDYRGEIGVILINLGEAPFEIVRSARIAQLVVAPVIQALLFKAVELSGTARGANGFGSTGPITNGETPR
jgi:dUTP pyrophosphatase